MTPECEFDADALEADRVVLAAAFILDMKRANWMANKDRGTFDKEKEAEGIALRKKEFPACNALRQFWTNRFPEGMCKTDDESRQLMNEPSAERYAETGYANDFRGQFIRE